MKNIGISLLSLLFALFGYGQQIRIPASITPLHPRLLTNDKEKPRLQQLIGSTDWARSAWEQSIGNLEAYVNRHQSDSSWIVSRLQMYWKSKSTDVFIKGGVYDHAEGEAPVPTVRFTGTRDAVSSYGAPKLEDLVPYMDDPRGLYYVNRSKPGQPLEWVEPSKTGRVVESINRQIMTMAQNAAIVYWYSGDEKYAKFAYDLFDTYMQGIYYRKEPYDLNHGHNQTLVGLSSFEVIHEDILNELTVCYDFLFNYIQVHAPGNMSIYAGAFKKWADLIIRNGVPFNNWDLIEARFVAMIALVLEDDKTYADGRGCQYYLDQILNKTAVRQWSLPELIKRGYDPVTGIWNESPGYSQVVINEFMEFVTLFDRVLHFDLLEQLPLLKKAVLATAQYLMPNGYMISFGDSHYGRLSTAAARQVVMNAQKNKKPEQEELFTKMIRMVNGEWSMVDPQAAAEKPSVMGGKANLVSLLTYADFTLKENIPAGELTDFVSPLFYSPNVSWLIQRNGRDPQHALALSLNGSKGNHMHANGISLELYGKGLPLAPEAGVGSSYFQPDYAEYYSKFPAHNTVVVNGISSYPEMRSNHGFQLKSCYPASGVKTGIFPHLSFSDLYFLEPETNADQQRLMSIIRTSDTSGYYIDVFRSRRKEGGDKYHDYFYHNMGQGLSVSDNNGKPLPLQPVDKLAFANGDLFAYDYLYDERSVQTTADIKASFQLKMPGRDSIFMNMWMKGSGGRELFTVKSPKSTAIDRGIVPKEIADLPLPTIVARQYGEAWTKPFVAVYEPSSGAQPASIVSISSITPAKAPADFTGIVVKSRNGSTQTVFSTASGEEVINHKDYTFRGTYGVVSEYSHEIHYLFLGNGRSLAKGGVSISTNVDSASVVLCRENNSWYVGGSQPFTLTMPLELLPGRTALVVKLAGKTLTIPGRKKLINGSSFLSFALPALPYTKIE
ncbi:heparinase II/III domain-containing protein [Longitalea arenae]|uniref:heparinase II/III domain-containing protein n=1 Tax=Longitalea arenae TaxID=2812558 RepID=UPI0019675B32|nr:heparinase II/III family protein [Longitalea arenae]